MSATAKKLTLWELGDDLDEVVGLIMENGGEIDEVLEARLDEIEGAFDEKAERIALKVRELEANAKAAKEEADRLAAIRSRFENTAKRIKGYLMAQMVRVDRPRIETHRVKVWIQRNGRPSIRWTLDMDALPDAYRKVEVSADTQAAYEAWKADEALPDGFEVEVGHHVRIG